VKRAIFLNILLLICIVTGCADKAEKAKDNEPIKIGLCVWPGFAHAFIAKEKGFFEKNGVNVELVFEKEYLDTLKTYKNGDTDGVLTLVPEVIMFNAGGIPAKMVCVIDYSDTGDVIIGRAQYDSLADLKDKTVSFESVNTFSHMFVLKALENAGLNETDIRFENVPAPDVLKALEEGRIDAGHTWNPTKTQALKAGYKILAKAGDIPGMITDVLAFSSKIIKERPTEIRAIVKSMLQARDFVYTNRVEAIAIMAKAEGMTEEEMADGVDGVHHPDLKENVEAMKNTGKSTSIYYIGDYFAEFFLNRGQLSQKPNLDKMIEPRFINELARDERIKE
jgi:NitT/TauT family transport system substrate-binding protein